MAEVYVLVSGHYQSQERWQNDLSSLYFPVWEKGEIKKAPDGKPIHRRLLVSPIQMYKIATNKENIKDLIPRLGTNDYVLKRYKILDKTVRLLRKILGLKPVPKPDFLDPRYQPNQVDKAVAVTPIGIKDDEEHNGVEQI